MKLKTIKILLQTGDTIFCCFLFYPLMLCYWRGIWDLWGVWINPEDEIFWDWITFAVGSCSALGYFLLPVLNRYLNREHRVKFVVVTRIYMYLQAALYVCYWRGGWVLGDYYYTGQGWQYALISLTVCLLLLLSLRGLRMVVFPPLCTSLDTRPDLLDANPRFGTLVSL